jgi:hypothetical protein
VRQLLNDFELLGAALFTFFVKGADFDPIGILQYEFSSHRSSSSSPEVQEFP